MAYRLGPSHRQAGRRRGEPAALLGRRRHRCQRDRTSLHGPAAPSAAGDRGRVAGPVQPGARGRLAPDGGPRGDRGAHRLAASDSAHATSAVTTSTSSMTTPRGSMSTRCGASCRPRRTGRGGDSDPTSRSSCDRHGGWSRRTTAVAWSGSPGRSPTAWRSPTSPTCTSRNERVVTASASSWSAR